MICLLIQLQGLVVLEQDYRLCLGKSFKLPKDASKMLLFVYTASVVQTGTRDGQVYKSFLELCHFLNSGVAICLILASKIQLMLISLRFQNQG